jgi:DNA-binding HxlR family transcriptional regulator
MPRPPLESFCPRYHHAVELIGRRWTGAIIRMLLPGSARFNALRAAVPDISDRMLAERLRELETEGIITRTVIPDVPVRVEYELTTKGRALEGVVLAIAKWAEGWITAEEIAAVEPAVQPVKRAQGRKAAAAKGGSPRKKRSAQR